MTKAYQGKREDGKYDQFNWDGPNFPTEEETGLTDIEEITSDTYMN